MKQIADNLLATIAALLPDLQAISELESEIKPAADKWSKKEILGHLIDSANNNHQKFVRMAAQKHLNFVGYAQNHWVDTAHYQLMPWQQIIEIWQNYNVMIAHLIATVDPENLENTINIDGQGPFQLGFIMSDYVEHLKHHTKQILTNTAIESAFVNVYK